MQNQHPRNLRRQSHDVRHTGAWSVANPCVAIPTNAFGTPAHQAVQAHLENPAPPTALAMGPAMAPSKSSSVADPHRITSTSASISTDTNTSTNSTNSTKITSNSPAPAIRTTTHSASNGSLSMSDTCFRPTTPQLAAHHNGHQHRQEADHLQVHDQALLNGDRQQPGISLERLGGLHHQQHRDRRGRRRHHPYGPPRHAGADRDAGAGVGAGANATDITPLAAVPVPAHTPAPITTPKPTGPDADTLLMPPPPSVTPHRFRDLFAELESLNFG